MMEMSQRAKFGTHHNGSAIKSINYFIKTKSEVILGVKFLCFLNLT